MARPSSAAQRSLTLTEELEKLEQSITLTLQEIDHNFSRAHRIVTSSILPVVEQYAEHSRDVWEGSRFWKQFFEASANVSLNGYEENPEEEEQTLTATEDELLSEATPSNRTASSYMETPRDQTGYQHSAGPSPAPGSQTPRAAPAMGQYTSPYEAVRRQYKPRNRSPSPTPSGTLPSTPKAQTMIDEDSRDTYESTTPDELPPMPTTTQKSPANDDILMHRILDRNYRIQATPLNRNGRLIPPSTARRDRYAQETPAKSGGLDLDLDSSPMEPAPTLRADLFQSPAKKRRESQKEEWNTKHTRERVPGVSVLSPAKGRTSSFRASGASAGGYTTRQTAAWDSDSDEDIFDEMSPPKTMQFTMPASKLMKTPAREASKRIVEDLMTTAGLEDETDDLDSPSIVRKDYNMEEDTF